MALIMKPQNGKHVFPLHLKLKHGDAGDRTRGLSHAKRTLYH